MLRQQIQGLQHGSCVSHRFFFREDANLEAKSRAIANEFMDFFGKMTGKDCYFIYPCTHRQFQLVLEHRLTANRNQRFRQIPSNGSQTDAGSTCNDDKVVKLWGWMLGTKVQEFAKVLFVDSIGDTKRQFRQ